MHHYHAEMEGYGCGGRYQVPFGHMHGEGFSMSGPGMPRRFLRPVAMLLLAEQSMHGYELMGKLKEFGIEQGMLDPSILYRILRLLEADGFAESTLDDSGPGPARKVYSLTPEGREMLDFMAAGLDNLTGFLKRFEERYGRLA